MQFRRYGFTKTLYHGQEVPPDHGCIIHRFTHVFPKHTRESLLDGDHWAFISKTDNIVPTLRELKFWSGPGTSQQGLLINAVIKVNSGCCGRGKYTAFKVHFFGELCPYANKGEDSGPALISSVTLI